MRGCACPAPSNTYPEAEAFPNRSFAWMRHAVPDPCEMKRSARCMTHIEGLTAFAPGTTMRAPKGALRASALSSISHDHGRTP
jgi:hypothetical protein